MDKWEYNTVPVMDFIEGKMPSYIKVDTIAPRTHEDVLAQLGATGWELVCHVPFGGGAPGSLLFKRKRMYY